MVKSVITKTLFSEPVMSVKNSVDVSIPGIKERLKIKYINIANSEARMWLFKQMLDRGLTTRDIQSFTENQASLRREFKLVDKPTQTAAMRAKLKDITLSLKTLKTEADLIKTELLEGYNNETFRVRKTIKPLRIEANKIKENLLKKQD